MNRNWRWMITMSFADRLTALRRSLNLTQTQMAEATGIHLSQIKRYESGHTQPSLDILRKIALALHVSADLLVFDDGERGPADDLKLAFEAVSQFDDEDKAVARKVLHSLIMQHHNKQVAAAMQGSSPADRNRPIKDARA
jgi:transcriptional regulator with XRE-family HTH domain